MRRLSTKMRRIRRKTHLEQLEKVDAAHREHQLVRLDGVRVDRYCDVGEDVRFEESGQVLEEGEFLVVPPEDELLAHRNAERSG
jgi:hypothetical protein